MQLSDQALGAVMMALQNSIMHQTDIVPVLKELDFYYERELDQDVGEATLFVSNPPIVKATPRADVEIEVAGTEE